MAAIIEVVDLTTFEEGHREIVLCEAILRSAEDHRWVDVDYELADDDIELTG